MTDIYADTTFPVADSYAGQVAARLDRLPFTRTLWRLVFLISIGGIFELYDLFMTAYIAPGLVRSGLFTSGSVGFFSINGIGFFVFCTFAGMWLGCMVFGSVADRLGRRSMFTFSLIWYSLATAVMACQTSSAGIDLCRFIAAIGVGLEQVTIDTFLTELVPPQGRGKAFAFYQFIEFLIVPVVALLGWLLVPISPFGIDGWRWVAMIAAVGAVAAWGLRLGLPESPRWLALHGHEEKAEKIMRDLETKIAREAGVAALPPAPASEAVVGDGKFSELFKAPYGKRTLVLSVFNLAQTIAFYGFGAWVPTLLISKGIHVTTSLQYAFIIALANPVGPLLGIWIADKMERKWQIVSAGVGIGIFMLFFARQTDPTWIIFFGVLVTLFNNWISFVFHGFQAEQYPTRIRARAIGFVYSWSRVSAALAGLLIGFFLHEGGTMGVALFIGAAMLVMIVAVGVFGPRTLNRSLEELSQ
ncbi:MFS transporter (plasmid) [Paraburkholderia sp. PREW-6R]|uniref:MFS transporter n=1 Tax=Paraburkholderia sp. PREW-6R TaxID=3141544 RepID=UPI0031F59034